MSKNIIRFDPHKVVPTGLVWPESARGLSVGEVCAIEYMPEYMLCAVCRKCGYPPAEPCEIYVDTVEAEKLRIAKIKKSLE